MYSGVQCRSNVSLDKRRVVVDLGRAGAVEEASDVGAVQDGQTVEYTQLPGATGDVVSACLATIVVSVANMLWVEFCGVKKWVIRPTVVVFVHGDKATTMSDNIVDGDVMYRGNDFMSKELMA